jgi:hypothetical protein
MKYSLLSSLLAGAVVLSLGVAHADVLRLTSPVIPDNGTLAIKTHVMINSAARIASARTFRRHSLGPACRKEPKASR